MHSLLLLNGGVGARVAAGRPKQLVHVNGIPILVYALVAADRCAAIEQIVLNYPDGWRDEIEKIVIDFSIATPVSYVPAGRTRHESVARMLPHCQADQVVIHESARPLVSTADFDRLIAHPAENVSYMLPIPFTVAPVDPQTRRVTGALDRSTLRNVQLPQRFAKQSLVAAHRYAETAQRTFTEDATLCSVAGYPVEFIDGDDRNFKVTTPTDVALATHLLSREARSE
ncbi:2-C-methyl-D-erythritol 4-phosphate cytidylyltransferase [Natronosporangium hydrolyticum]|uniref:2-C-methyl-D-erythritol 4-phosphate cytidylyltransferase n=1 Tax=Natronosporangium hydrolyticum TaxID=2811111 RepID=A0A895YBP5_9ACTN|nr:2-C-methyl-D-erythritol 4-phosphate cytidylyltransferase [Natronosporangium hydrolyticum]QSB15234.1 2-C-methyl-D-erythritol 4-phosphate cytidylyltransferase [Natronosporangium hydrolyticum]